MSDPAIPLRAHQVLCLQGFRGSGYSDAFVARMTAIHDALAADHERLVTLGTEPDVLCDVCPHLVAEGGCTLQGPDHEAHMKAHDREVLRRLGLQDGAVVPWSEARARIGATIRGTDLPAICTTCPWLPMGACAEGVDALGLPDVP